MELEAGVGIEPAYVELQSLPSRKAFPILVKCLTHFHALQKQAFARVHGLYKTITCAGVSADFGPALTAARPKI